MISQEYRMRVRGQVSSTARRKALYNHDRIVVDHIQTVDSVEEQSRASGRPGRESKGTETRRWEQGKGGSTTVVGVSSIIVVVSGKRYNRCSFVFV